MQTKLSKVIRRVRVAALCLATMTAFLPGIARASWTYCHLSGQNNSFQAFRLDVNFPGSQVEASISIPLHEDIAGQDDYYSDYGFLIFDATGKIEDYYLHGTGAQRPRVLVANGSQTLFDVGGVTVSRGGLGYEHIAISGVGPGTHYLVGFSFGSAQYSANVSFSNIAACVPLNPPATLVQKDQTDFTAPGGSLPTNGQVYAIAAGAGFNLKLAVPNPRRFFVGYLHEYAPVGTLRMNYATPAPGPTKTIGTKAQEPTGTLGSSDNRLAVWTAGTANFTLNYSGVLPNVNIDGWLLDL